MRFPTKRLSFIAFYSCSRLSAPSSTRSFSLFRSQCPNFLPSNAKYSLPPSTRPGDRRSLHATSPLGASKDPYSALGVAKGASQADIKKAYFALARKYHPDTNSDKNARDKFVEIQEAYDTLKDEKKRAAYDQYGSASQQPGFDPNAFSQAFRGGSGGFSGFQGFASAFGGGGDDPSSLFESLFSGGRSSARSGGGRRARGDHIETTVNISFMESCKGAKRKVKVSPIVDCAPCSGSGLKSGAKRTTCTSCGGSGTRTFTIDAGFQMASTCGDCQGAGSRIPHGSQCGSCGGVGKVRTSKVVDIEIPPGVEDGMAVQIQGGGDAPISGQGIPGDLYVRIRVTPSKQFTRQGANLFHQAKVPFHTALLGGRVRVPTIDGDVDVRLPAGTQQGEEMVLKGRGVPQARNGHNGDLYVNFMITLPRNLTQRQRELLQAYVDDLEGRTTGQSQQDNQENVDQTESPTSDASEADGPKKEDEKKRATG